MIYFFICANENAGREECRERGWVQVGADRFYTPNRDDIRLVRRFTDIVLLPGGTWFIPAKDFYDNPQKDEYLKLIDLGAAQWLERPKEQAVLTPVEEPEEDERPFNPPLISREELVRGRILSTGYRRGRPPSQR